VNPGARAKLWPAAVATLALLACGPSAGQGPGPNFTATPLVLRTDQPETGEIGGLIWRGGFELRASDPHFGGLSGLMASPDGSRLTAVSDKGSWVEFAPQLDAGGDLVGLEFGDGVWALCGTDGKVLHETWDLDAESLARLPDGSLVVAFEHNHRLWRYPAGAAPLAGIPAPLPLPQQTAALRRNSGFEALSELPDGDLLAIAEGSEEASESPAFLWRDGVWSALVYRRDGGFRPTGATLLPDGDLLVLERSFSILAGVRIRLVRVPGAAIVAGASLEGTIVAELAPPVTLDNMEGIAATRGPAGETLVYLISDDNFNALQRTLLLLFALRG